MQLKTFRLRHFPSCPDLIEYFWSSPSLFYWIEFPKLWLGLKESAKQNIPSHFPLNAAEITLKAVTDQIRNWKKEITDDCIIQLLLTESYCRLWGCRANNCKLHFFPFWSISCNVLSKILSSDKKVTKVLSFASFCMVYPYILCFQNLKHPTWHKVLLPQQFCVFTDFPKSPESTMQKAIFHVCTIYG